MRDLGDHPTMGRLVDLRGTLKELWDVLLT